MDQVDFEPAQHWNATILKGDDHHSEKDRLARSVLCNTIWNKASLIEEIASIGYSFPPAPFPFICHRYKSG